MDGPFVVRRTIGGGVALRGGSPREGLIAEVAREVDDDVCVVDAVSIGQILVDLGGSKSRYAQRINKAYNRSDVKEVGSLAGSEIAQGRTATHNDAEANETLSGPGVDRKLVIGTGSSLNADDDFVRVPEAVRTIYWDKAGLAGETTVPRLEAVLGA